MGKTPKLNLDYSLHSSSERTELLTQELKKIDPKTKVSNTSLSYFADYILSAKENAKDKSILTDNRMITINKRETSFEGLASKFENGEDGIYNIVSDLGKNARLTQKMSITQKDLDTVPGLKELRQAIEDIEEQSVRASGKRKYLLKKQAIEMRQQQYLMKNNSKNGFAHTSQMAKIALQFNFEDDIYLDENKEPVNAGLLSFFNPKHIEALLCNYSNLKQEAWGVFDRDLWYLMEDLDNLAEAALKDDYPLYYDLLQYKIDGLDNPTIKDKIYMKYGFSYSVEYISSLWRKKIPKLIAEKAKEKYLIWYFTFKEKGKWKKCSQCGQVKLAHNRFFSKNKTSSDGFYSICKDCRRKKTLSTQQKQALERRGKDGAIK